MKNNRYDALMMDLIDSAITHNIDVLFWTDKEHAERVGILTNPWDKTNTIVVGTNNPPAVRVLKFVASLARIQWAQVKDALPDDTDKTEWERDRIKQILKRRLSDVDYKALAKDALKEAVKKMKKEELDLFSL